MILKPEAKYLGAYAMFVRVVLFFAVISLTVVFGCVDASKSNKVAWPESRPLGQEFRTFQPPPKPAETVPDTSSAPDVAEPNGVITLRQALAL